MDNYSTSHGVTTWSVLTLEITVIFAVIIALHEIHSSCNHVSDPAKVGIWNAHVFVLLCLASLCLIFTPEQPCNHWPQLIGKEHDLSPSSMWMTLVTESRYSFYRMG